MEALLFTALGICIASAAVWSRSRFADFLAQRPADYPDGARAFDLRTHLNGPVICEGVIFGPTGRVTSRFVGEFDCKWDGNKGRMQETFRYDDGSTQDRCWHLTLGNDGHIRATADDVVGTGEGTQKGDAVQLRYRYRLPASSGGHVLDVVDWMYLAPNGTIVNRSQFRKYGIKMAELVATMRPAEEPFKEAA